MGEKEYLLDTNAFIYPTNPGKQNQDNRRAAINFWKKARMEIEAEEAVLCIPREVVRELDTQSYSLGGGEKQQQKILDLLEEVEVTYPDIATPEIEHQIRMISAYVGEKYRDEIKQTYEIDKVKYGGVSDARILYTAWQYECVLVTANVRDFIIYPLFFEYDEERLYDILNGTYKKLDSSLYNDIVNDQKYKEMVKELCRFIEEATDKEEA